MSDNPKFCPQCGAKNDDDAIFCASCGNKFDRPQPGLGDDSTQPDPTNAMKQPLSENMQMQANSQFQPPQQSVEVDGLVEASNKMITDPRNYSLRLLSDPDAPSAFPLVLIKVILTGVVTYFTFANDEFFNAIWGPSFEAQGLTDQFSIQELQNIYMYLYPGMLVVIFLAWWYVGSWILGILIKGGLANNSPLKVNPSRAMRQLNGYRQIPLLLIQVIMLIIVLVLDPATYNFVLFFLRPLSWIGAAIILWRGLGEHVGYQGNIHKYLAGAIIGYSILTLATPFL